MIASNSAEAIDDFARRGNEVYERVVRTALGPEIQNQFVAIDVDSGCIAFDENDFAATERLQEHSKAKIWLVRVGQPAAYRIGGASSPGAMK